MSRSVHPSSSLSTSIPQLTFTPADPVASPSRQGTSSTFASSTSSLFDTATVDSLALTAHTNPSSLTLSSQRSNGTLRSIRSVLDLSGEFAQKTLHKARSFSDDRKEKRLAKERQRLVDDFRRNEREKVEKRKAEEAQKQAEQEAETQKQQKQRQEEETRLADWKQKRLGYASVQNYANYYGKEALDTLPLPYPTQADYEKNWRTSPGELDREFRKKFFEALVIPNSARTLRFADKWRQKN